MDNKAENELLHYGIKRRSGRFPYGSGDNPYQHSSDFLARVEELKKQGWEETPANIKAEFGLTTTQYRTEKAIANSERRSLLVARAKSLKEDGLGNSAIGREMGLNESTVRSLLNSKSEAKMKEAQKTADFIKEQIEKKGMIDVGRGTERELNVSSEKFNQALYLLQREGYPIYGNRFEQPTNPGQWTTQKIICPKGTPYKDVYDLSKIHALNEDNYISRDGGESFEKKFTYPASMDSKRLKISYDASKDGLVEIRRGVQDLSLGESRFSQVRILVDGTHYIKGMAVYSDKMPPGVDVVFNTSKGKNEPVKGRVLKQIKDDPDNPFGSAIKDVEQGGQYWYTDKKDGKRKLGLINKRADEGDWSEWADALPSQFLGKQSISMAKKQLNLAKADKQLEYEDICALNNPTIKKHLLQKFADECDSAAVHLKAAALPGQKYHVIVPINSLKDTEVYAPGYADGTKLALVRYPHGGTFEIPIVTVNNKHKPAIDILGKDASDGIGINAKVAARLSGADFDGDTVMCIPTHDKQGRVKVTSTPPLKKLEGFDPHLEYGPESYKGKTIKLMTKRGTELEMGKISNLITDMTLSGKATSDELARAVRHSMVVIDANKHSLDYKQSEMDNDIASLRTKYQRRIENGKVKTGGASTILSQAKGQATVDKRKGSPKINIKGKDWYDPNRPEGALIYTKDPDATYEVRNVNKKTGKVTVTTRNRTQKSTRMAETDDAYTLVSEARHPMELVYAEYANSMKAMANRARMTMVSTGKINYSAAAKEVYKDEVASLDRKLNNALLNTARERAANRKANAEVTSKKEAGILVDKSDVKKASQRALTKYRQELGSISRSDRSIKITDREWEAIQAGAISETKLKQILNNTDVDELRQRATPKTTNTLSTTKINKIKNMRASGNYTLDQIAKSVGVSTSAVSKYLKGA